MILVSAPLCVHGFDIVLRFNLDVVLGWCSTFWGLVHERETYLVLASLLVGFTSMLRCVVHIVSVRARQMSSVSAILNPE